MLLILARIKIEKVVVDDDKKRECFKFISSRDIKIPNDNSYEVYGLKPMEHYKWVMERKICNGRIDYTEEEQYFYKIKDCTECDTGAPTNYQYAGSTF